MASSDHNSMDQNEFLSRIEDLTGQLDAAHIELQEAAGGMTQSCAVCNGKRRPGELVSGVCRPCRQIQQMQHHLAKLRIVTEMSVMMAGELSASTGESRHLILDHFERQAAARIDAADAAVRVSKAS